MLDALSGFVAELRAAGLAVSLSETIDAARALGHVTLEDREALRLALAATLVKDQAHRGHFDAVFDVYFGPGLAPPPPNGHGTAPPLPPTPADPALPDLAEAAYRALAAGDQAMLELVAGAAVARLAGMATGRSVGVSYYLYATLRHLDLDGALARLQAAAGAGGSSPLEARLARDEHLARLGRLRRAVEAEIRARLVADRGARAMAASVRRPLPADVDFMHASAEELAALGRAIAPLTRRLAARLALRRRQGRRGRLDFRSTVRHSLSYGGVPAEPRFRRPQPAKPEIVVIADVSGSVAAFARFTLQLVYALSSQFSRVRSFVFVDGIDEVTAYFESSDDMAEALARVNNQADVIWADGHSDYGHALEAFWARWGPEVTSSSSVILLGDARNNYHASGAWVVEELGARARHLFWLDPEPRSYWDTGDSIVSEYARYCDGVFECRNLRQLALFVDHLA